MLRLGIRPDRLAYPFVLKSIGALGERGLCGVFHGGILKMGLEFDSFVRVSLVDMYVKLELLGVALQLFDESPERSKLESILLWNVLIAGCCKAGELRKATKLFEEMPERNAGSWNSLINGFMRSGEVERSMELFVRMPHKDVVSWTTMVNGFLHNGQHEKALQMFSNMLAEGVRPNDLTVVSALSACAKIGALEAGVRIHNYISSNGFKLKSAVGTALVDMYSKCGHIDSANKVFGQIEERDLRTWSVMIWGWALHGCVEQALQYFEKMMAAGVKSYSALWNLFETLTKEREEVGKLAKAGEEDETTRRLLE
ncbi:Pentatricopeptide repeat-containing protein [Sarracenia purpurea var. burkii]